MSRRASAFLRDRSGNFALFSAIGMLPLLMAGGIAVDYTSLSRTKAELQQAMDTASLAVAREGTDISDAQARQIASDLLTGNFGITYSDMRVRRDGSKVTIDAISLTPLTFGSLFGYDKWPVVASSAADIATVKYEIALVLDTTGSMKGGKLASMKEAVTGMIEQMSSQVDDPTHLKYAVVPFANFVNVGPQFAPQYNAKGKRIRGTGAAWLDLDGKSPMQQVELTAGLSRFQLFDHLGETWAGCVETRTPSGRGAHDVADTPAVKRDKYSLFVPAFSIDEPDTRGYSNSYITSTVDPLDNSLIGRTKKLLKYGIPASLAGNLVAGVLPADDADGDTLLWGSVETDETGGRGPNQACVTQPIMALNSDYDAILAKVNSLQANGTTNIMEGVAWGQRVLSPGEPFSEGTDLVRSSAEKVMIVLTDGANVFGNRDVSLKSSYSSHGYLVDGRLGITGGSSNDTNRLMNEKTLAACDLAKAEGTVIYTIRLEEPDVATGTMLQRCATSPAHYFDAPSRSQLDDVFRSINERVVRLRIAS
jgi:Flp pilus assembly protein TadG